MRIAVIGGGISGIAAARVLLASGHDVVVYERGDSLGGVWTVPFLPPHHRALLEQEPDGAQLYRHLLHPRIPRLAFAGYNHGFMHVPTVEVATLWLCALLRGDLELPPAEEMEQQIEQVRAWKREHILFEPSRACATNTRFHQYLDVLLGDLGLDPRRKSNPIAELVAPYTAADYAGLVDEYERARGSMSLPRRPLALAT